MKLRNVVLLFLLVMAVLVAPAGAQDVKSITFLSPQEPDNLNPDYSDMFFSTILGGLYLNSTWTFNDQLEPTPQLATEIPSIENGGLSEDGKTITITLRDDIVWSDGTPITSADFKFRIDMVTNPANLPTSTYPWGENDGIVASVETPDAQTLVINLVERNAAWLSLFGFAPLPQHILQPVFDDAGTIDAAAWNRAPTVSAGPYVFAEWETGGFTRFTRNENYWGTAPAIDEVVVRYVIDSEAYMAALLNGEAEVGTFLDWGQLPDVEASGLFNVVIAASGYNEQWNINLDPELGHPALQDVNVRKALFMAVNREAITADLLAGLTYPPATPWEGTPYQSPNLAAVPYDPEAAAQLLDEAGWVDSNGDGTRDKDGVELVLRYVTSTRQIRVDTQAVAQQQLAEVGIGTELRPLESGLFDGYAEGGMVATGDYDIAQWSATTQFPDPNTSVFLCSQIPTEESPEGGNYRRYCNPEVDALFAQANQAVDVADRTALFNQISELIYNDYVYLGIWFDADNWEISNRLTGVRLFSLDPFWNVYEWDLTE